MEQEKKDTPSIGNKDIPTGYYEKIDSGYDNCGCNAGFKHGIVLDPFIGAGTTAIVALKQGKKFIGIEINKEYIAIANKRIQEYIKKTKENEDVSKQRKA